jgi:ABC-type multidrug transport system fused ATPase/permease subunit
LLRKAQKQADTQKKSAEIPGWSNGKITNLMATDTFRIDLASGFFHMIWCAPIAIILTAALLITNLTYSAIPGLALFLLSIPLLGRAVRSLFHRRIAISKATDQRLGLTQEVLQAIRFIKYLAWESKLLERLDAIRKREISGVKVLLAIQNGILAIGMSLPIFASMLSFITYSLSGHTLDPAPIFSSLALFNSLRLPLNFLPMVIGQVIDAHASIQRIQEFLLAEEAQEDVEWNYEGEHAIVLEGANFTWEHYSIQDSDSSSTTQPNNESPVQSLNDKQPFAINNLNFTIGRKELVAIIGNVGSGKSSVLAALAGDMRKTKGRVVLGGSRAFCPQYAWIQSTTFKENIVFGKNFNKDVYDKVLYACALQSDLDALPNGDSTEIGERGITVSGGQKQRINIARAIYFDADIVLMDDPLSAVDPHVGSHIMDTAICGLLKDKARILVTHQLHFLNRCDRIIMVDEGRITAFDTFDNLMSSNSEFQQLMTLTTAKERGKESDTADGEVKAEDTGKVGKRATDRPQIALMREEERAIDSISWDVWFSYVRAGGSIWIAPLVLLLLILSQGTNIATSLWISWWMSDKWGLVQGAYVGQFRKHFGYSLG